MRLNPLRVLWPGGRWRWLWRGSMAMAIFTIASVEVTSQSWFCNSCHIMGTYYRSWQSSGHKNVDCVKCHIPPGTANFVAAKLNGAGQVVDDLLHRTSNKPSASVSDFACTRSGCHDVAKVRASARRQGRYFFDHAKHVDLEYQGIVMSCTTCHSHVQGSQHFEVNTAACVTCHLARPVAVVGPAPATQPLQLVSLTAAPKAKTPVVRCDQCHQPPQKPIEHQGLKVNHAEYLSYGASCESCHRGVTAAAEPVKDEHCFACHDFGMEKAAPVVQMHRVHSQGRHKVECFNCHGVTRHGPSAQSMRLDQIDCRACHQDQHLIQQRAYSTSVPATLPAHAQQGPAVTPMFLAHVDCTGCHVKPKPIAAKVASGATVAVATPQACDACHKPGLGQQMVPLWQKNTRALYESVSAMLPPAGRTVGSSGGDRAVAEARQLLDIVRLDGSWGVHNPRYTQKLLEQAKEKLQQARPTTRPGEVALP